MNYGYQKQNLKKNKNILKKKRNPSYFAISFLLIKKKIEKDNIEKK